MIKVSLKKADRGRFPVNGNQCPPLFQCGNKQTVEVVERCQSSLNSEDSYVAFATKSHEVLGL